MSIESAVSALPGDIVAWLQTQEALSDVTFMTEFPAAKKAIPLKKVIVAIGLQSVTLTDKFVDDGNGVLVRQEYCRTASMRISLSIHVPFSLGGHTCHEVFSNVADALSFASDLAIMESGCEKIVSDRDTDALVLNGYFLIEADFCPAVASGMQFQSFMDKELLCGTHIRDDSIHVTQAEKDNWNHPLRSGRYLGTGTSSRTINLGFRPAMLFVFADQYALTEVDSTSFRNRIYAAQGTTEGSSYGLTITDTGFTVRHGMSSTADMLIPCLNESGATYFYIAIP
jgi:hypothetical protein